MIKNLLTFLPVILAMLFILGIIDIEYINVFIVLSILAFVYNFINYAFKQDNPNSDNNNGGYINPEYIFTEKEQMQIMYENTRDGIPHM